jgi:hypothetical protein
MAGEPVRGTLVGYPQWILQQYKKATAKDDSMALTYILERWAHTDPEAERYGVSIRAYRQEREGAEVVHLTSSKKKHMGPSRAKRESSDNG